jgi:hypothetical protein
MGQFLLIPADNVEGMDDATAAYLALNPYSDLY